MSNYLINWSLCSIPDVGLGYVDALGRGEAGQRMYRTRSLTNLSFWLLWSQHEFIFSRRLLQKTCFQHPKRRWNSKYWRVSIQLKNYLILENLTTKYTFLIYDNKLFLLKISSDWNVQLMSSRCIRWLGTPLSLIQRSSKTHAAIQPIWKIWEFSVMEYLVEWR